MGWSYNNDREQTKADFVRELLAPEAVRPYHVERHTVVGNHVWAILGGPQRMIVLFLIAKDRNGGWGYKDMTESMGPAYYTCPLSFLDAVTDPGGYATAWRERVRRHHQHRAYVRGLKVGDRVRLVPGLKIWGQDLDAVCITSTKPLACRRLVAGQVAHAEPSIRLRPGLVAGAAS